MLRNKIALAGARDNIEFSCVCEDISALFPLEELWDTNTDKLDPRLTVAHNVTDLSISQEPGAGNLVEWG